jgi:uncharacterized membrane protein
MRPKTIGFLFIAAGIAGILATSMYDLIVDRGGVSYGSLSFSAVVIAIGLIIMGIIMVLQNR